MSALLRTVVALPTGVQRALAIVLLVGIVLVPLAIGDAVVSAVGERADALRVERETAGRLHAMVRRYGSADALPTNPSGADDLALRGPSPSVIGADLQNRLSAIAAGHGVTVSSAGAVQPRERDGMQLVGVRIAMSGPFEAVHAAITEMEEARPLLFVEKATLRTPRRRRGGADGPLSLSAELEVLAAFTLAGDA